MLPISTRIKMQSLAHTLNARLHTGFGAAQIEGSAHSSIVHAFPRASAAQVNVLVFLLLAEISPLTPSSSTPTLSALSAVKNDLKGRLDSMNEMSEMTSMRLQMAMDRRSKFVEALSNIMKKIDSTQETIVQNLKG